MTINSKDFEFSRSIEGIEFYGSSCSINELVND